MILQDVELEDFIYPCFAFVKRRIGKPNMTYEEFNQLKEYPCPDNLLDIPIGAVVKWHCNNGDNNWEEVQLTLKRDRVVSTWANYNVHFGVYEGNGFVSDLCVGKDVKYIRYREITEIYTRPIGYILME